MTARFDVLEGSMSLALLTQFRKTPGAPISLAADHRLAMDESHLISAVCYVNLNPVRARLVARPEDGHHLVFEKHVNDADDGLVTFSPCA